MPAGGWEYKVALNDAWDENYGLHAQPGGDNIPLNLAAQTPTKFYYDHETHWITDSQSSDDRRPRRAASSPSSAAPATGIRAASARGSRIPTATASTRSRRPSIPAGHYEAKAAIDESWDENYGAGGVPGGANIAFNVPRRPREGDLPLRRRDPRAHDRLAGHAQDGNVEWDGLGTTRARPLYRTPGGAVPQARR